jgi:hypothetical protein
VFGSNEILKKLLKWIGTNSNKKIRERERGEKE